MGDRLGQYQILAPNRRRRDEPGVWQRGKQSAAQHNLEMRGVISSSILKLAPRLVCALSVLQMNAALVLSPDGITVYDSVNNITWLADFNLPASNRFGIPVCTVTNVGVKTCINPSGSMNYGAAEAWVAAMNAAKYLGQSNWQLPTTPLVDNTCGKTGPNGQNFGFGCTAGALDTIYNSVGLQSPNTSVRIPANTVGPFSNVQPYLYWSQSVSSAGPSSGNAAFSFATGWQGANTLPNFLYLWPMIPGKLPGTPAAAGTGLQVNLGGATIYDPMTNITWLANANLAATNTFGLPRCTSPTAPSLCVAQDGAMTWNSARQYIANLNTAAYLGQTNWQAPTISTTCAGYGCDGSDNPMGNLFYDQFGLVEGAAAVATPNISVGPFNNLQPYLYWSCVGNTIQDACQSAGPAANFEESYSFGAGFQGTDLLANDLYVTAYFVGPPASASMTPPQINAGGIVIHAGTSSAVSLGSLVDIYGTNLAAAAVNATGGATLPTMLGGVEVLVNGTQAPLIYVGPFQIIFQVPYETAVGTASVVVVSNTLASASAPMTVQQAAPSILIYGNNRAVVVNQDGSVNAAANGAKPGDVLVAYMIGSGPLDNSIATGADALSSPLSRETLTTTTTVGNSPATVQFAGMTPGFAGLMQLNFVMPNLTPGDYPMQVTIGGFASNQPLVTVSK